MRVVNACWCVFISVSAAWCGTPELTIEVKNYVTMPMTGAVDGAGNNASVLARINFLREEPGGGRKRFFVNDLNGPLYILDKESKKLTTYLNFNGIDNQPGIFHRLTIDNGMANGFINFQFDPDYLRNGKFYTLHLEDPALPVSNLPDNKNFPGFKTAGYTATRAIHTPGETQREAVIIEWTDSNTENTTFEGTAREIMRVQYNTRIHPMGELIFNPTARPGDPDWRVLYIGAGDGGSGEAKTDIRSNPQRLDTLVGKILRIIPELGEHVKTSTVSDNGRYRIPNDNPFAAKQGARKEIWALGLRNPHRLSWDVDPADSKNNHLIASVIGLRTWETVVMIHKGANYGYSLREGGEQLNADNLTSKLPDVDKIPLQIDGSTTDGMVTPTYPVIAYGHVKTGGDAVSSGFVYRGKALPELRGKFLFGDISTGRIWWVDFQEMLASESSSPHTMAEMHEVKIRMDNEVYGSMAPVTEAAYHARGGKAAHNPGFARISGGRSDIRLARDGDGELYILSKSDGMIRAVTGAAAR